MKTYRNSVDWWGVCVVVMVAIFSALVRREALEDSGEKQTDKKVKKWKQSFWYLHWSIFIVPENNTSLSSRATDYSMQTDANGLWCCHLLFADGQHWAQKQFSSCAFPVGKSTVVSGLSPEQHKDTAAHSCPFHWQQDCNSVCGRTSAWLICFRLLTHPPLMGAHYSPLCHSHPTNPSWY